MANGTNSMRDKPFPSTRGRSAAIVRDMYYRALDYKAKIEKAGNDKSKLPPRDIGMDALVEVLNGKRIVHYHTHRADDISIIFLCYSGIYCRRNLALRLSCIMSVRAGK